MSYAIATVIYGVPLLEADDGRSEPLQRFIEDKPAGVISQYSGSADWMPAAFGVQLCSFNECEHHMDISKLVLSAGRLQQEEYTKLFFALSEEEREIIDRCGKPRTFILWSTS